MEKFKEYVVLSSYVRISTDNYHISKEILYPFVKKSKGGTICEIELDNGIKLYFTTYFLWNTKFCIGNHDVKKLKDFEFMDKLHMFLEKNRGVNHESI